MADLTERLVAKLMEVNLPSDADASIYVATLPRPHAPGYRLRVGKDAADLLPLLLSEPELVASLPDAVRVKALESPLNAAPVMESAFVDAAEVLALAPEELRLSVLTPRERAVMRHGEAVYAHNVLLRERWNDHTALEESDEEIRSSLRALQQLAHDKGTNPEVPRG